MIANWIIYLIAVALCASTFVATNAATPLAALILVLCAPATSILINKLFSKKIAIDFTLQQACIAGGDLSLTMDVHRPSLFKGNLELEFEAHNLMQDATWRIPVTLSPTSSKQERFELALRTDCCGRIALSLAEACTVDTLGFSRKAIPASFSSAYTVYPVVSDMTVETAQASHAADMGTAFDVAARGQDKTEVFDLREYVGGDSLHSVHWKLSARMGDLMVREPSRPTDYEIALILGARACDPDDGEQTRLVNAMLSLTASLSLAFVRQGLAHCVVHDENRALAAKQVRDRATFDAMIDSITAVPLPREALAEPQAVDELRRSVPITKTVLVTDHIPEQAAQKLARETTLTVLRVGDGAAAAQKANGYLIVNVPLADVDGIGDRVKNLEL